MVTSLLTTNPRIRHPFCPPFETQNCIHRENAQCHEKDRSPFRIPCARAVRASCTRYKRIGRDIRPERSKRRARIESRTRRYPRAFRHWPPPWIIISRQNSSRNSIPRYVWWTITDEDTGQQPTNRPTNRPTTHRVHRRHGWTCYCRSIRRGDAGPVQWRSHRQPTYFRAPLTPSFPCFPLPSNLSSSCSSRLALSNRLSREPPGEFVANSARTMRSRERTPFTVESILLVPVFRNSASVVVS